MGCSSCKPQSDISPEEKILQSFEKSLGVHKLQLLTIDRVLHRYSSETGMSTSQFERAVSELSLNSTDFQAFYSCFYEKYQYNMKKLNCLGILLSEDQAQKKLKILFQSYDSDTSGNLSGEELAKMINDLTEVACVIIPKGAWKLNLGNEKFKLYVKQIGSVRKSLVRQFVGSITEGKESINEREFNLSYQRDDGVRNILSTRAMREYCYYMKTHLIGSVDDIMLRLVSVDQDHVFDMLSGKSGKKRKSRKNKTLKVKE